MLTARGRFPENIFGCDQRGPMADMSLIIDAQLPKTRDEEASTYRDNI